MQQLVDKDCDNDPKEFVTTDDNKDIVKLSLVADDGVCGVECHSKHLYELTVGYHYTKMCRYIEPCKYCNSKLENSNYEGKKPKKCEYKIMKKYNKDTDFVSSGYSISILNGDELGFPMTIDIVSLIKIQFDTNELQKIINKKGSKIEALILNTTEKNKEIKVQIKRNKHSHEIIYKGKKKYVLVLGYYLTKICKTDCEYCFDMISHSDYSTKKPKSCKYKQLKTYKYCIDELSEYYNLYISYNENTFPLIFDVIIFKQIT
jgi:2-iminoacetate synthase ThiH